MYNENITFILTFTKILFNFINFNNGIIELLKIQNSKTIVEY